MMAKLLAHVENIARTVQADQIEAIASTAAEELSGVAVMKTATGVVLRGKHLLDRWLLDPALRFLGSFSR